MSVLCSVRNILILTISLAIFCQYFQYSRLCLFRNWFCFFRNAFFCCFWKFSMQVTPLMCNGTLRLVSCVWLLYFNAPFNFVKLFLVVTRWGWRHEWLMVEPLVGFEAPVALHPAPRIDSAGLLRTFSSCRLRDDLWPLMHCSQKQTNHISQIAIFSPTKNKNVCDAAFGPSSSSSFPCL